VESARAALQAAQSECLTVEAVQKAALGKGRAGTDEWLARHKLETHPRLAQQLEVENGWERAVETALGSYLEAVCVDGVDSVAESLDALSAGQLTITESVRASTAKRAADTLLARVHGPAVRHGPAFRRCRRRDAQGSGRTAQGAASGTKRHHARRNLDRTRLGACGTQ
jgi:chromosome segregation protein